MPNPVKGIGYVYFHDHAFLLSCYAGMNHLFDQNYVVKDIYVCVKTYLVF